MMTDAHGLTFRDLGIDDLTALHELMSDWQVVRQLGSWPWPPDLAFTASRCKPYDDDGFVWGVRRAGQLIGTVAVTGTVLGYTFALATGGRGIATAAVLRALTEAFGALGRTEITADTWADNTASRRVLTKVGFVETAQTVEHAKARNAMVASVSYRLTHARWHDLRSGAQ